MRIEANMMKNIFSPSSENTVPATKSKASISKTKGLEGFT